MSLFSNTMFDDNSSPSWEKSLWSLIIRSALLRAYWADFFSPPLLYPVAFDYEVIKATLTAQISYKPYCRFRTVQQKLFFPLIPAVAHLYQFGSPTQLCFQLPTKGCFTKRVVRSGYNNNTHHFSETD